MTCDNAEFAIDRKVCKGFAISDMGALIAESETERFESTVDNGNDNIDKELGRGKRQKQSVIQHQCYTTFWCHDDNGDSNKY